MDKTDKKILGILQNDSSISNQDLADKVALSPSPCSRRVKQLEQDGYIKRYAALLDHEKINLKLTIIISVSINTHDPKKMQEFEDTLYGYDNITECYLIAGQTSDYLLKVLVSDMDDYHTFLLHKLSRIEIVKQVSSSFVLRRVIDKTALPLDHI